jgi:hypothetical protein
MTTPSKERQSRRALRALVAFALWSLPTAAIAEEPSIEEIQYHPAELPPVGTGGRLMLTGAALMVGWYGVGVGTSYLWSDAPNAKDLRLPFVGPWMALGDAGCGPRESSCTTLTVVLRTTLGVLSGVGQAGGLFAFAEGVFLDTGNATPPATKRAPKAEARNVGFGHTWTAAPVALPDGGGIEIVGTF